MIVEKNDQLRDKPMQQQVLIDASLGDKLSNDEEMPLLVVLLHPTFPTRSKMRRANSGSGMDVGHSHVRHVLPGLIRYSGNDFKHFKFGKRLASVRIGDPSETKSRRARKP